MRAIRGLLWPDAMQAAPNSENPRAGETDESAGLVEVGRYRDLAEAHEHGLVALAMSAPCWVMPAEQGDSYSLQTEADAAAAISREIRAYEQEQATAARAPRDEPTGFDHAPGWALCGLWILALAGGFFWQQADPTLVDRAASSSTGLIGRGEYWRPFTALFLHADVPHLVGNLVSGTIFGTLLARMIGAWRAWFLILVSGTLGNATTSLVTWPEAFLSIGASTAVFGALGILSGLAFAATIRSSPRLPWAKTAAPLIAGVVLLGWLGGGGVNSNTDVLGHVFGFGSGLVAGFACGLLDRPLPAAGSRS